MDNRIEVMPLARIEKLLVYTVPPGISGCTGVGALVRIPLRNRTCLGLVVRVGSNQQIPPGKTKPVLEGLFKEPSLTPELIRLAQWLHRYYAAPTETVLEVMIPAAVRRKVSKKMRRVLSLERILDESELTALSTRAPKQAEAYRLIQEHSKPVSRPFMIKEHGISPTSLDGLTQKGILSEQIKQEKREVYHDLLSEAEKVNSTALPLTEEQKTAVDDLTQSIATMEFRTHLLHGVTGSGKTEVYLHTIQQVLASGGSVIYLVPELALTPQTVGRLRGRLEQFGEKVVVWHSHLSHGERSDAWFALVRGEAKVVVGARSAIFSPMRHLRLIIVDEEHDPAYKQGETPRYHGRDVAVYRAMLSKAVCVLGSATPSMESLYNVQTKNYRLNRLTKRIDDRQLPFIHLVDMRMEKQSRFGPLAISNLLAEKLQERFEQAEQSILFLNRRGYSPSMLCSKCSYIATCEHCDVTLTYHRPEEELKCHICGYRRPVPRACPQCQAPQVKWRGFGTQRIEAIVAQLIPGASIVRLDADTLGKKHDFRKILGDFRTGKIDILIGTQMIAKGLDFPNVTLVGLIHADISLHVPDFRAAERTFQLLVQVSGRAGRGEKAGEVVVQTMMPHSPPIQYARHADFDGFLEAELEERREFNYPPYRHLVRHLFRGPNLKKVQFYAEQWAKKLEESLEEPIEIRGPVAAPLEKMKDHYRFHLWYFIGNVSRVLPLISAIRNDFKLDKEVIDVLDVDPVEMM